MVLLKTFTPGLLALGAQQHPRRGVQGSIPSSPLTNISPVLLQNKCFRYWPDKGCAKEYGCICVRNVSEREAQGYYLRELEIVRTDRVSPLLLPARCGKGLELRPWGFLSSGPTAEVLGRFAPVSLTRKEGGVS